MAIHASATWPKGALDARLEAKWPPVQIVAIEDLGRPPEVGSPFEGLPANAPRGSASHGEPHRSNNRVG